MIKILKRITWNSAIRFFNLFIKNPQYLIPTFRATVEAFYICQKKYGIKHQGHGPENAYRHALWSMLIRFHTRNLKSIPDWTLYFTAQYELIFPNDLANKLMDEHNNLVGFKAYEKCQPQIKQEVIKCANSLYSNAKPFQIEDDLEKTLSNLKGHLVYIKNMA